MLEPVHVNKRAVTISKVELESDAGLCLTVIVQLQGIRTYMPLPTLLHNVSKCYCTHMPKLIIGVMTLFQPLACFISASSLDYLLEGFHSQCELPSQGQLTSRLTCLHIYGKPFSVE